MRIDCTQQHEERKKRKTKNIALWPFNQKYNKHKSTGNLKVMPKKCEEYKEMYKN